MAVNDARDGDDELADNHACGAGHEDGATAESFHGPECNGCRANVDDGGDHADQEGVVDSPQILEVGCAVVKHEVDTSPSS